MSQANLIYWLTYFQWYFMKYINLSLSVISINSILLIFAYIAFLNSVYTLQMQIKWNSFSMSLFLQTRHVLFSSFAFLNLPVSICSGKMRILVWAMSGGLLLDKQYFTYSSVPNVCLYSIYILSLGFDVSDWNHWYSSNSLHLVSNVSMLHKDCVMYTCWILMESNISLITYDQFLQTL